MAVCSVLLDGTLFSTVAPPLSEVLPPLQSICSAFTSCITDPPSDDIIPRHRRSTASSTQSTGLVTMLKIVWSAALSGVRRPMMVEHVEPKMLSTGDNASLRSSSLWERNCSVERAARKKG